MTRPELTDRERRFLERIQVDLAQTEPMDPIATRSLLRYGLIRFRRSWFGFGAETGRLELTPAGERELDRDKPKPPNDWSCNHCRNVNPPVAQWCCECGGSRDGTVGEFGARQGR